MQFQTLNCFPNRDALSRQGWPRLGASGGGARRPRRRPLPSEAPRPSSSPQLGAACRSRSAPTRAERLAGPQTEVCPSATRPPNRRSKASQAWDGQRGPQRVGSSSEGRRGGTQHRGEHGRRAPSAAERALPACTCSGARVPGSAPALSSRATVFTVPFRVLLVGRCDLKASLHPARA